MEVKASARYIRISPRKVRLVVGLLRGQKIDAALAQLKFVGKLAAGPVQKVLDSAVANAVHNFDLKEDNLFIKEIRVDCGPVLKRWLPRAHGRATPLLKRMSHINIILAELKDSGAKTGRKVKADEPMKLGGVPKEDETLKVKEKSTAKPSDITDEKDKKIIDPRREGRGGQGRSSGKQGFTSKLFNRKAG
jgi:large subunit ribosomal protein L22